MKKGIVHPIHKKGKPKKDPGNYRGICTSPILVKVLDKITLAHQQYATPDRIHNLQFGFTPHRCGTFAAFLLNECIADAKDKGTAIYIASLDVQKAFVIIRHNSLLDKLHQQGLPGQWWLLKVDKSYKDLSCQISWNGSLSESFHLK